MKILTSTKYVCDICGTEYNTENEAKQCENLGNLFKEHKEKYYPNYCWYIVENSKTKKKHILYVNSVQFDSNLGPKCTLKSIKLIVKENEEFFDFILLSNIKKYNIIEILNVNKCYEKYGLIPKKLLWNRDYDWPDSIFNNTEKDIEDLKYKEIELKYHKLKELTVDDIMESTELKNYLLKDSYLRDFSKITLRNVIKPKSPTICPSTTIELNSTS